MSPGSAREPIGLDAAESQRIWVAGLVAQSALASRALLTGGAVLASRPGQPAAMTAAARDAAAAVPAAAEVLVRGGFR